MKFFNLFFSGVALGSANVIPGLSGGTIAVITKKYARLVSCIGNLIPNIKAKNKAQLKSDFAFLIPLAIGIIVGILIFAIALKFFFDNYIVATSFAIMGLIIGTIPELFVEADLKGKPDKTAIAAFVITLLLSLILAYFKIFGDFVQAETIAVNFGNFLLLMLFGFVAAGTMIIPGISGSLVLMLMGGYKVILNAVATILDFSIFSKNVMILLPFGIGVVVGFFVFSYVIAKLLKSRYTATYYGILGFCIGSIPCLYPGLTFNTEGYIAIILLVVFAIGSFLLTFFAKKNSDKKAESVKENASIVDSENTEKSVDTPKDCDKNHTK